MNNYEYKKIKDLGTVITGKTPSTEDKSNFGDDFPFITPTDIPTFDEKYIEYTERGISNKAAMRLKNNFLPKDSICFVCIGSTIGKMCLSKRESFTNQQINSLIVNENYNTHYIFYLLKYVRSYFQQLGSGTGSGKGIVNKTTFEKSKIQIVKEKYIQNKIAYILSAYDDLIENNNKRIKVLEKMAENLYKEWFVRFRFPGYETAEFENGIPKGWEYKKFSDIYDYIRGVSYSTDEIECDEGENLINLKNIQGYGGFRRDGTKKYNGKFKQEQRVKYMDLVMGVTDMTQDRRTVGAVALIPSICGVISADLIKLTSEIDNVFSYCLFRFGCYSTYISQFGNGANVIHLKPDSIKNMKIIIPENELITNFISVVKPMMVKIEKLNLINQNLVKQRDLLLPRLMSGKLEVKICQI